MSHNLLACLDIGENAWQCVRAVFPQPHPGVEWVPQPSFLSSGYFSTAPLQWLRDVLLVYLVTNMKWRGMHMPWEIRSKLWGLLKVLSSFSSLALQTYRLIQNIVISEKASPCCSCVTMKGSLFHLSKLTSMSDSGKMFAFIVEVLMLLSTVGKKGTITSLWIY